MSVKIDSFRIGQIIKSPDGMGVMVRKGLEEEGGLVPKKVMPMHAAAKLVLSLSALLQSA